MKKVLFLITNLAHGGAERVLVNLANNLDKGKYDVTVQTIFDEGVNRKYLSPDVRYQSVFSRSFHGIKYITKFLPASLLHRFFIREKYDIEIAYLEGPPAKIISGCPYNETKKLAWIHIELDTPKAFSEGFLNKSDAVRCYKRFDKIVCVAQTVKNKFIEVSGIKNNIEVRYNTNETEIIKSLSEEVVDDFDFSTELPVVCSVAKVEYTKGYDRLLNVHYRLIKEGVNHKIIIIGTGSDLNSLKKKALELGVNDTFHLIGFRENPYKYMKRSDLYICSSRREGFSTAVTEALILGLPVVSTDCSGACELLGNHNDYGLVVENCEEGLYDGLKYFLDNPERMKIYKKKAEIRGQYFSKEVTVHETQKLFN